MKTFNRWNLTFICLAALVAGCSTVPKNLRPPTGEEPCCSVTAKGMQIYECRAKQGDASQFEWAFKGPEADLFDRHGAKIGKHYASPDKSGPVWESNDGSKVMGKREADAPAKKTDAIPWLLLSAKKTEGNGVFSKVTSIQRLDTTGGKAPAGGCDSASAGKEIRVPYTATYKFYTR